MNALGPTSAYEIGPLVRAFVEHAQKIGFHVVMWATPTNIHPWETLVAGFRFAVIDRIGCCASATARGAPRMAESRQRQLHGRSPL